MEGTDVPASGSAPVMESGGHGVSVLGKRAHDEGIDGGAVEPRRKRTKAEKKGFDVRVS